jgi:hypothetical protein
MQLTAESRDAISSRQCSTQQLDLTPAEGGRAVLSGAAALCRNEPSSAMQDLPFKKLFKGLQFGIADIRNGPVIEVGLHLTSRYRSQPRNIP